MVGTSDLQPVSGSPRDSLDGDGHLQWWAALWDWALPLWDLLPPGRQRQNGVGWQHTRLVVGIAGWYGKPPPIHLHTHTLETPCRALQISVFPWGK